MSMAMETNILAGGVAVITGSANGIGAGIARAAAARGMRVVLADIAVERLNKIADELSTAGTEVLAVPTDVTDPAALDHLAAATREKFGDVRLLVNNAGIETIGNAWELTAAQWERVMRINVLGPIHGVRAFAGAMVAAGAPAFISNVASLGGLAMMPEQTPYIMSKHAVLSFSECLSLEMSLAAPQIRVSAILPGPVATRIFTDAQVGSGNASYHRHRDIMDNMMAAHGMPPDEAGRLILDQIAEGRFWVSPHPEMLAESARQRAAHLAKLERPSIRPEALAIMGRG
jgi:NAD(P)-dependent dehydrogenase (short-subunit alcohol dehydrogenase family)